MIGKVKVTAPSYSAAKIILEHDKNKEEDTLIEQNFSIFNKKLFHNDVIEFNSSLESCSENDFNYNVLETERHKLKFVGTLILDSKYKYGYNKKNIPFYLFKPFNYKYPDFLVSSSLGKKTNINQIVVIKYKEWEENDTIPKGILEEKLGDVDNFDTLNESVLHIYSIYNKLWRLSKSEKELLKSYSFEDYVDHTNLNSFSIDPPNCKDIDDCISVKSNSNPEEPLIVGIHIASTTFYLDKIDKSYNKILNRISSIYAPDKIINMLPQFLSENLCSLVPNKNRPTLTLWLKLNRNNEILDYTFEKAIICSKKAFNYEEAQNILDTSKNVSLENSLENSLEKLYTLSKILGKKHFNSETEFWDTHKMVEVFMLLANHYAAKFIHTNSQQNIETIYRIHKQGKNLFPVTNKVELDDFLHTYQSEAAIYDTSPQNYFHFGLNVNYYTHFTSPIRRCVDNIIHKQIIGIIDAKSDKVEDNYLNSFQSVVLNINSVCENINKFQKNSKKAYRKWNELKVLQNINKEGYEGYIYDLKYTGNSYKISVYIPSIKINVKINLIDPKFLNIFSIELINNDNLLNKEQPYISLVNNQNNNTLHIELYKPIKIKLFKKNIFSIDGFLSYPDISKLFY